MSNMKHTKGPWHMGAGNGEGGIFAKEGRMRLESGGTTLYPICKMQRGWATAEDDANARLVAAAPELLAALLECVRAYEVHRGVQPTGHLWSDPNHIFHARNAIAKATEGENS